MRGFDVRVRPDQDWISLSGVRQARLAFALPMPVRPLARPPEDWASHESVTEPGRLTVRLDGVGLNDRSDAPLRQLALSRRAVPWRFALPAGQGVQARCLITALDYALSSRGEDGLSLTLVSSGPVSLEELE